MIRTCKECGFILGTRPGLKEEDGVCLACVNAKKDIDYASRQEELKGICETAKSLKGDYDCVVAVSGGKDSTVIVAKLVNEYAMKPLLVTVTDEFTHTKAGEHNCKNIAEQFNCDHLIWRCEPQTFKKETLKDFTNELHPLKWIEKKIYEVPVMIAKKFGIKLVFFGENSSFQYGTDPNLETLHPASDDETKVLFFFAFYKYNEAWNRTVAKKYGFKDLEDFGEWYRQGNIERYTQQDSIAYIIQLWTKFIKFGFQRVSDMACRFFRAGELTREQVDEMIKSQDWVCDPQAKEDFCKTIGISQASFNMICDTHANKDLLEKDVLGNWRRKDLM